MSDRLHIADFLIPLNKPLLSNDRGYKEGQVGFAIEAYEDEMPDLEQANIVFIGCGEQRGAGIKAGSDAADEIRKEFYNLYYWHQDIRLVDLGNIKLGKELNDTYAALKIVVNELVSIGKTVVILGGSHDLTLAQYNAFVENKKPIEAVGVDAFIDINIDSPLRKENFLMEMLTSEPNYMKHYNHLAFQSFFMHPRMLETMDKLRFDCFRVGTVKEEIEEMEPVIRNCQLFSFDVSAIAHAYAPSNHSSPNGLTGEEACTLLQYAGMSSQVKTIGIYGYKPEDDKETLTAKQISHMLWYLIDGKSRGTREALLEDKGNFNEYTTAFAEVETLFMQSKKTGRWWMQMPDKKFIACSYKDYQTASSNEYPERWLRAQERS
ncbi:MAG: formimidoylglutamase [Bacteroidota bacterium]|nr:formimidoylglutamase [Bacteroidota bacterium]